MQVNNNNNVADITSDSLNTSVASMDHTATGTHNHTTATDVIPTTSSTASSSVNTSLTTSPYRSRTNTNSSYLSDTHSRLASVKAIFDAVSPQTK